MSNKADSTNMKQAIKRELKPKLRFPEFRDAGEWDEKRLDEMFDFHSTANNSRADLSNAGNIFYIHYGDIHTKFHQYIDFSKDAIPKIPSSLYKNATFLKNGDLVIADASEDTEGIAKAVEVRGIEHGVKAISGLHTILLRDSRQNYINGFKGLLREIAEVKKQIKRLAVGVKVYSVSKTVLKQVLLPLPSHPEQQKIADCLLSIDELITAQTQKLATLKTHKKAMMQQLFPAEGEILPKLRFPEFCDAGEWERMKLGEAATFYNGKAYKQEELLEWGKYKVLRVGNFFTNNNWYYSDLDMDETKYCDNGDLLYAWSASFGPRIWEGEKVIYHYHIWKVVRKKIVEKKFLFLILEYETERIKEQTANGLGLLHITKGTIEAWESSFPGIDEQKKIAECLSSIDELITAQTQKLDTLKTHKKGLMQQLFPTLEEVQR